MSHVIALVALASSLAPALAGMGALRGGRGTNWNYEGFHVGDWPEKGFPLCAGKPAGPEYPHNEWQAPIDIPASVVDRDNDSLVLTTFAGGCDRVDMESNGHTWEASWGDANCSNFVASWRGRNYTLQQLHFHFESENKLGGHHQDMEVHLVHQAADGASLVIGVFLEHAGQVEQTHKSFWENGFLRQLFFHGFLAQPDSQRTVERAWTLNPYMGMFSEGDEFYSFLGSLTTPPCTPNLEWVVLKETIPIATKDLHQFEQYLRHAPQPDSYGMDDRPVQPLNGRRISIGSISKIVV